MMGQRGPKHVGAYVCDSVIVIIKTFVHLVGLHCNKYSFLLEAESITPLSKHIKHCGLLSQCYLCIFVISELDGVLITF
jgi:hypothetical protein